MPVNADSTLVQKIAAKAPESSPEQVRATYDMVIRWAPLVIPLFGALIVAVIFFIDWSVLTPSM